MAGGEKILQSIVKPCGMGVLLIATLNMSESLHLAISYLLRSEHEGLED